MGESELWLELPSLDSINGDCCTEIDPRARLSLDEPVSVVAVAITEARRLRIFGSPAFSNLP